MLEKYKDVQENAYNTLIEQINNYHISHAYLIDENNYVDAFNFALAFVKDVVGNDFDADLRKKIFDRIDKNCYSELKIIVPDGNIIKKQQIIDLQKEFSMTAIEGKKRVYIIRSADKMRSETANSMLKFLEEPDNNIMAILMTNNINGILETIISRCQNIKLNSGSDIIDENNLYGPVVEFIDYLESNGIETIIKEQELLFEHIGQKDRLKFEDFFDKMIDIYYDIMKICLGNERIKMTIYIDNIKQIAKNNTYEKINRKINYLVQAKERIKNNVNINLLVDDLIVNIGGYDENSWS